ncbi:MAG: hypothetical protein GY830_02960 [Bacteroidetes bacterium]|nr:hypothetical protein [Bacteroidota bacterium]
MRKINIIILFSTLFFYNCTIGNNVFLHNNKNKPTNSNYRFISHSLKKIFPFLILPISNKSSFISTYNFDDSFYSNNASEQITSILGLSDQILVSGEAMNGSIFTFSNYFDSPYLGSVI